MNTMRVILATALVAAAALASCTKETSQKPDTSVLQTVTATVTLQEGAKVEFSEKDQDGKKSGLKSVWEAGDFFYALKDGKDAVRFDITGGEGTSCGTFTASASGVSESTAWTAMLGRHASASTGQFSCRYDGQDGSIGGIGDYVYVKLAGAGLNPSFNFNEGTKLTYVMRILLPAGVRYIEYCTAASWKSTSTADTPVYDGNFDTVYEIDLGAESKTGDCCYIAIPAVQYSNWINENPKGVIITFLNASRTKSTGKTLSENLSSRGGQIHSFDSSADALIDRPLPEQAVCLGSAAVTMARDSRITTYNNLGDYVYTTVVAPEWAPYNLGANVSAASGAADIYGAFFCWGETAPRTSFSSSDYTYNGSRTVGGLEDFPSTQIGSFKFYDVASGAGFGKMKLQHISGTKYDAARVMWGKDWRMPREEELLALTGSTTTLSGLANPFTTGTGLTSTFHGSGNPYDCYGVNVAGREFKAGNKSVFFPYGGVYKPGINYAAARGYYWSDSRIRATPSNGNLTNNPLKMSLESDYINFGNDTQVGSEPYYGMNIRPVRNRPGAPGNADAPGLVEDDGGTVILPTSNLYGTIRDNAGNPLPGITVSDGYQCCLTDDNGVYQMTASAAARTVSVTVPADCEIPLDADGRPAFFAPVTIPSTGAVCKDFTLVKRSGGASGRFTIIAVADAHVQNASNLSRFSTAMEDVQETATALGTAIPVGDGGQAGEIIGIALGDQMWDNMSMAADIRSKFCGIRDAAGKTVPFFYVIGNHDHDCTSFVSDYASENSFVSNFGPTNYSFDRGNAHIIVMDDIIATGTETGGDGVMKVTCKDGFTQAQVDWLKADVAKVSNAASKVVVFCTHGPLNKASGGDSGTQSAVMSALKNNFLNVHVLSGHTHCINNNLYKGWAAKSGRNIYEHTLQSLSGYWWDADISYTNGSPAGYGVFTFDSSDIFAEYNKVTKEDAGFQMRVYNGGDTYNKNSAWDEMMHGGARGYKEYTWDSPAKGKFVVRIPDAGAAGDADDYWTVNISYNGSTSAMTRVETEIKDAAAASYIFNKVKGTRGDANGTTDQIWYSGISFGTKAFTVTATHTMKSGWKATYTSTKYIGTDYKGFAWGERY